MASGRPTGSVATSDVRRGADRSTVDLERAIIADLDIHNEHPKPFIWTRSADQILANLARFCQRTLDSGH